MTISFSPSQTAQGAVLLIDTSTSPNLVIADGTLPGGTYFFGVFRFTMPSTTTYLVGDVTLNTTFSGIFGNDGSPETFRVLLATDPNAMSSLVDGFIDTAVLPSAISFGEADYVEIGSETITEYGSVNFVLNASEITRIMMKIERVGDTFTSWNGELFFWLIADQDSASAGVGVAATLTAGNTINYANRFTGLSGPWDARSRVDECPVCGDRGPRETWAYSPWHKRMTCAACVDPADPYDIPLVIEGEDPLGSGEDT